MKGAADLAVILARGASRRMGRPKGLVHLADGMPLVCRVGALYTPWARVVVVVPQGHAEGYRRALAGSPEVAILAVPGGEDTARTLWWGWQRAGTGHQTMRLWAHPVDLPLVKQATVATLRRLADRDSDAALRPYYEGRPGHPVVIPSALMMALGRDPVGLTGPFRAFLDRAAVAGTARLERIDVLDEGVVRDFDTPQDLARDPGLS